MKSSLLILLLSFNAVAADFTVEFTPAPNSVGNPQVSDGALSSSKIINFASEVVSALSSSLSSYVLKSDVPNCSANQFLVKSGNSFSCQAVAIPSSEPTENLIINGDFSVKTRFLGVEYLNTTPMPPTNVYTLTDGEL